MDYCYDFPYYENLNLSDIVKDYTKKFMSDDIYVLPLYNVEIEKSVLSTKLCSQLNEDFRKINYPDIYNIVAIKRKNRNLQSKVHIDSFSDGTILNTSLIIPIENFQNTYMYWMNGNFTTSVTYTKTNLPYTTLVWQSDPTEFAKYEILKPTLCRVNIPHSATNTSSDFYRLVVAIRFVGNPTVDQLIAIKSLDPMIPS